MTRRHSVCCVSHSRRGQDSPSLMPSWLSWGRRAGFTTSPGTPSLVFSQGETCGSTGRKGKECVNQLDRFTADSACPASIQLPIYVSLNRLVGWFHVYLCQVKKKERKNSIPLIKTIWKIVGRDLCLQPMFLVWSSTKLGIKQWWMSVSRDTALWQFVLLKVFEELLLDGDWALNAGNWQWLSASAFFHQFFRVYSPVAFGKKTDKNGDYIK